jgi:hypothetical protein
MYHKYRLFFAAIMLFSVISFNVTAQVNVFSKNAIDEIKNGTTHVIINPLILLDKDAFMDAFKKYWTYTKGVDFVNEEDLKGSLVFGDTYFSLGTLSATNSNGTTIASDMFFGLWTPKERAVRKGKDFSSNSEHLVASITLTQNFHPKKAGPSTDGTGPIGYWTPGNLKNFLQQMGTVLLSGKKILVGDDITDKAQLRLLQNQTLFCTPDIFYQYKNDDDKTKFISEVFEDYKYDYRILTPDELSAKILADKELFYYVVFLHNNIAGKIIAVVNSRTGQLIYSKHKVSLSVHIKSGDLKDIYKEAK